MFMPLNCGIEKKTSLDYLTVKHHFSWTDFCVDNIYSSLPLVEGFDLPRPNIKYFQAAFYDKNVLTMSYDVSDKESKLLNFLVGLRNKGFYVMTWPAVLKRQIIKNILLLWIKF